MQAKQARRRILSLRLFVALLCAALWLGPRAHGEEPGNGFQVGVRYERAVNFVGGLQQVAVTGVVPLPFRWQPLTIVRTIYFIELAGGAYLDGSPDARPFVEAGPALRLAGTGSSGWFVGFGIAPALIGGTDFRDNSQLGGSFFFTTHLTVGWKFRKWWAGLRFQHTSNAHMNSPNPGVNMLGVQIEFNL